MTWQNKNNSKMSKQSDTAGIQIHSKKGKGQLQTILDFRTTNSRRQSQKCQEDSRGVLK